ncbi:MAG: hypothetical protein ACREFF_06035 [Candidatus Udaeobacter sp.]
MKTRNPRSFFSLISVARSVAAIFLMVCLFEAQAQTSSDSSDANTLDAFKVPIRVALGRGETIQIDAEVSTLFGLPGSNAKGIGKRKLDDGSLHSFSVILGKKDLYLVFKSSDESYSINWRTDKQGRLLATVYSDKSGGTRLVPNSSYAKQFQDEISYWKTLGGMEWGGTDNTLAGKWTALDGATWEFSEFKPGEKTGELKQGEKIGRYSYTNANVGQVKIEMPTGTILYSMLYRGDKDRLRVTLTDSEGHKLELARPK